MFGHRQAVSVGLQLMSHSEMKPSVPLNSSIAPPGEWSSKVALILFLAAVASAISYFLALGISGGQSIWDHDGLLLPWLGGALGMIVFFPLSFAAALFALVKKQESRRLNRAVCFAAGLPTAVFLYSLSPEPEHSIRVFRAEFGNADAQQRLYSDYCYGTKTRVNYEKARYWLKRAADNGDVQSQFDYGFMHDPFDAQTWLWTRVDRDKLGIKPDAAVAVEYLRKAYDANSVGAREKLPLLARHLADEAVKMLDGESGLSQPATDERALGLLRLAVKAGNVDAITQVSALESRKTK
jgi:TPR repeat protein